MPVDYGRRLTAVEQARLRRARLRAGVVKPPKPVRDSRTVSTVRAETAAREKTKRDFPTAKSLASPAGIRRLQQITAERNDYGRGSIASPKPYPSRTSAELKGGQGPGTIGRLVKTFVKEPIEDAIWAVENPLDRITGKGRAANGQMMWPGGGRVPKFKPGTLQPAKAAEKAARPAQAEKIIESLPEARRLRRAQEAGYSAERGKRAAKGAAAAERAGGGEAGLRAARAELKGELPTLPFGRLAKEFGEADSEMRQVFQPQVDEMLDFIRAHPSVQGLEFKTQNTQGALLKAMNGETPTKSEIRLLENVFGEEAAQHFKWRRAADVAVKALNLPRSMMSTADISFPFRQGLVMMAAHPGVWAKSWGPMLKSFGSPRVAKAVLAEIDARPTRQLMDDAGVKLTKFGTDVKTRDEAFISDWAEKIPGFGKLARASNRAFTVFGNKLRADGFDLLHEQALNDTGGIFASFFRKASPGLDELSPVKQQELLKGIGSFINAGTGRGGMGLDMLEKAAPFLTMGLFSPRLIASRVALLNPVYYATLPPFARKQAATAMLRLTAAGSLVLFLAKQAGAEVSDDPRSTDFGKIKAGDTRVDIWGGFQQYVVAGHRIAVKESVSSTTGEVKTLEGGFGEQSRFDIFENFLIGKASPPAAWGIGSAKGRKVTGEEFNEVEEAGKSFLPLGLQNAYEGFKESPVAGATSLGLGSVGFGVQTYRPTPSKKTKSKSLYGSKGKKSKSLYGGTRGKSKSLYSR